MYSHFSPYPFISFLFIIIINFSIDLPVSFSANDPQFSNCSQPFNCGGIRNVFYPFWGHGRAEYCGLPGYKLKCQDDSVEIEIQSQSYRVLNISKDNNSLRIATMESWKDNCPSRFVNISLPSNLLDYSVPSTQNLTLFYGCPSVSQLAAAHRFNCSINDADSNYYWADSMGSPPPEDLSRCNISVIVPVLRTLVPTFTSSQSTLANVLKDGFDARCVMNVSFCNNCEESGGYCGYDLNMMQPTCFCYDGQNQERCFDLGFTGTYVPVRRALQVADVSNANVLVWVIIFGIGTLIIVAIGTIICCCLRRKKTKNSKKSEAFLENLGALAPKRFNYSDVRKMTKSFRNKLGQGGYGSVFKGKLPDGRMVAVKVLSETKGNGEDFTNEVASISRTSHVNVVAFIGFCFEGRKRALIYEFVPNGSLEKFIHVKNPLKKRSGLGWETLFKIAIGIARGLEYLHRGCYTRILHFDIKPHNILLDQDFSPKISDFGLAKLCVGKESIVSMAGARGTPGYIAPEVVSRNFGGVSHKADVYSYGMMLLEMVGGRKNLDVGVTNLSEIYFPHWIYKRLDLNEDLGLYGVTNVQEEEIAWKMILVGLWCIQIDPLNRPAMSRVLEMLEGSLEALQIPPKPFVSSPAREQHSSSTTSIS